MSSAILFVIKNRAFSDYRSLTVAARLRNCVIGLIVLGFIGVPQAKSQVQAGDNATTKPSFEVASIKPNHSADRGVSIMNAPGGRLNAKNVSLKMLMRMAYKVQDFQISGGPAWINTERYDIEAKPESSADTDMRKMTEDQRETLMNQQRLRLQTLLEDRFQLTLHRETKELPVYALVIAKGGPKLHESAAAPANPESPEPPGPKGPQIKGRGMRMGRGELSAQSVPLSFLAESLSNQVGRTVLDKTGLKGVYDFTLKWTPDENQGPMMLKEGAREGGEGHAPADSASIPDSSGPSIFTAIQEQLGLKLESQKGPVEILVIDRVERPTEN